MSLINPESRWWNRDRTRRIAGIVVLVIAVLLALISTPMLVLSGDVSVPMGITIAGSVLPIPLTIGAMFLIASGSDDIYGGRMVGIPLAALFIAMGAGFLIADGYAATHDLPRSLAISVQGWLFVIGGLLVIAGVEVFRKRSAERTAVEARVSRGGVRTTGVVTRAFNYSEDYRPVARVTVQFADSDGNQRWAKATVGGPLKKGTRVPVRYLPDELGRRGAVVIG